MAQSDRPQVVIIGAGFGGLWAARALKGTHADVLMLDRNNYHTFLPLLYQVAAAELEPEHIVYPVRSILHRYPNVRFLLSEVTGIDFTAHLVKTREHVFPYDYLILATGSTSHFFGVPGAVEHAYQLKTLEQAIDLRNQILFRFERALCENDSVRREQMLTFTIVGGGPTGVEFSGALAELVRGPLVKDYPTLNFSEVHILLLEAADRLLPGFPERLQTYTLQRLRKMGVEVRLQATVSQIAAEAVLLKDGTLIPTETVVWTAGVRGEAPPASGEVQEAHSGRIKVLPTLQIKGQPKVYVVGDLAYIEEDGISLPLVAPVAMQQAELAVQNIQRQMRDQDLLSFRYRDPGTMVTLGRNAAVVQIGRRTFTGFLAWVLWLSVHLFKLIGFRNRLLVLTNWAWDYLFYERAVRLIVPVPDERV